MRSDVATYLLERMQETNLSDRDGGILCDPDQAGFGPLELGDVAGLREEDRNVARSLRLAVEDRQACRLLDHFPGDLFSGGTLYQDMASRNPLRMEPQVVGGGELLHDLVVSDIVASHQDRVAEKRDLLDLRDDGPGSVLPRAPLFCGRFHP